MSALIVRRKTLEPLLEILTGLVAAAFAVGIVFYWLNYFTAVNNNHDARPSPLWVMFVIANLIGGPILIVDGCKTLFERYIVTEQGVGIVWLNDSFSQILPWSHVRRMIVTRQQETVVALKLVLENGRKIIIASSDTNGGPAIALACKHVPRNVWEPQTQHSADAEINEAT